MQLRNLSTSYSRWKNTIDWNPLKVTPETTVAEAIALMSCGASNNYLNLNNNNCDTNNYSGEAEKDYLLVIAESQLVGILTERELSKLVALRINPTEVKVGEVMKQQVITWKETEIPSFDTALKLFHQQQISHLPILGKNAEVIGVITQKSLNKFSLRNKQQKSYNSQVNFSESQECLHAIITADCDGLLVVDREGKVCFINPAAEAFFGRQQSEILGEQFGIPIVVGESTEIEISRPTGKHLVAEMRVTKIPWQGETAYLASLRDISDRKQTELNLKHSQQRLQALLDAIPDRIFRYHTDGTLLDFQENELTTNVETLPAKNLLDLPLPSEIKENLLQAIQKSVQTEKLQTYEYHLEDKEKLRSYEARIVKSGENEAVCIIRNISDAYQQKLQRQRAEEQLRIAKERLELVLQAANDGFWDWNLITGEIYFSQRWKEMLGYSDEELPNELASWEKVIFPEDRRAILKLITNANLAKSRFQSTHRFHHKNGTTIYILSRAIYLRNQRGEVVRIVGADSDITEQLKAEEALQESQLFCKKIAETIPSILYIYDLSTDCNVYINHSVNELLGYSPEKIKGMGKFMLPELIHPEDIERVKQHLQECQNLEDNQLYEIEYRIKDAQGRWHWLCSREVVFERTATGKVKQIVGVATDITYRVEFQQELEQANEQLVGWVDTLSQRNQEMVLLSQMSDFLQACLTVEEAYGAIAELLKPLFPNSQGKVYILNDSKNLVEAVASWGEKTISDPLFTPNQCWALRRGKIHQADQIHPGLFCHHICPHEYQVASVCIPMMAQGETLGMLYLSFSEKDSLDEAKKQLAKTVSENLALTFANLKLWETLQHQSVRDPLTGLYNRRYLQESLEREIHRASRQKQSLGVVMLDIDHFKKFNDTWGHEAGDTVLREIGKLLQQTIRASDLACRYGGEELTLVFPETSLEDTEKRAIQIWENIKNLQIKHRGQYLGSLTVSLGIASFPTHGQTANNLINAADAALYCAKAQGRDRVVSA
ncbi:MAG: diguanylate cyclase [Oscillatoria sp. PMC 1068.18]|nr:diguanylate cyclase [Oscillatoria sp. PMC 1076.18]MEC4987774.1 diguanylate cyclase [Oscillatoria sp. PMC 1068.18]